MVATKTALMHRRLPGARGEPSTTAQPLELTRRNRPPGARFELAEFDVAETCSQAGVGDALRQREGGIGQALGEPGVGEQEF